MVSEFLSGFTSSPTEIILVVVLFIAGIAALVIYASVRSRREKKRVERSAEQTFQTLVSRNDLNQEESALLREIAAHLERPEKKYMLLRNQALFDSAARSALEEGSVPESAVSALRVRLGFSGMHAGVAPDSSVEIPQNGSVLVSANGDGAGSQSLRGRVSRHIPSAFCIRLDGDAPLPNAGESVTVVYFNGTGVYQFESRVTEVAEGELYLEHAEHLRRIQRREFHRQERHLPVYVSSSRPEETGHTANAQTAELIDVSAGGARIWSPNATFKVGSEVEMTFHPDSDESLHVAGTVVRRSRRGAMLHIRFDRVKEGVRRRLLSGTRGRNR
jgi:hypothetical protein